MAKVPDTSENAANCICGECPSFPGEGGFFCAKGKGAKDVRRRGCICTDCKNFREFDLADGYYCADGAAGDGPQ
jgi:hypothetical protein